jgi:hypothetical protein
MALDRQNGKHIPAHDDEKTQQHIEIFLVINNHLLSEEPFDGVAHGQTAVGVSTCNGHDGKPEEGICFAQLFGCHGGRKVDEWQEDEHVFAEYIEVCCGFDGIWLIQAEGHGL